MSGKEKAAIDCAREKLAPSLEQLLKAHHGLPCMESFFIAEETESLSMPKGMVDIVASVTDFEVPERRGALVWQELADEDDRTVRLIAVQPAADGALRVLEKARSADEIRGA